MHKELFQKSVTCTILMILMFTLSGCSLIAYKPSARKAEAVAKECINPNVRLSSKKITKEKSNTCIYYIYDMVDDRGIEFQVKLADDYVSIVEPIPPFLSNYRLYYNDYSEKVIAHYSDEIEAILSRECVKKYRLNGYPDIEFYPGTDYEEIADIIMKIDELVALDYKCGGVTQSKPKSDDKVYWNGFMAAYIRVIIKEDGQSGYTLFKVYDLSGNNGSVLTYDEVLQGLYE